MTRRFLAAGAGDTGSLWIGVDLPVGAVGTYVVTFTIGTNTSAPRTLTATLKVAAGAVAEHGDNDVYNLSRLRWLDSSIGVDEQAEWPRSRFANITSTSNLHGSARDGGGGFRLSLVNKDVTIGADGLPAQVTVRTVKQRQGKNVTRSVELLSNPVQLVVLDAHGKPIAFSVTSPASVSNHTSAAVSWTATLSGGGVEVALVGRLEMDSYLTFEAMLSASTAVPTAVSDVQLIVEANGTAAPRMLGMGAIGSATSALEWRWEKRAGIGNNRLWLGDVDAGVFVTPRGAGDDWVSPTYGKDFPEYPFLPTSWAGVGAANANTSIYGANLTLRHARPALRIFPPVHSVHTCRDRVVSLPPCRFVWRGRAKSCTTRARPSLDVALRLE